MKSINVGLIGFGTVGTGVADILLNKKELIRSRLGAELNLSAIADLDVTTDRGISVPDALLTTDAMKVLEDPDIDIILELIGGEGIAETIIVKAIENGKQVVTANKALIAKKGDALFRYAREKGVEIAYEASVGGCMPVIKTFRESLIGNTVTSISGILNGTCNYILSQITQHGTSFEDALADAQKNGFAEADPTLDVEGFDTAHKLAIMNTLAYGMKINLSDIYIEGISNVSVNDFQFAKQFGYTIKLLAISKINNGMIEARVHPTMIPDTNLLASVSGSINAVNIMGDATEDILLYGRGAGMMPTASAVVGDISDLARNILSGSKRRLPAMSYQLEYIKQIPVMPIEELDSHYYIRFNALDKHNVLSKITGILGANSISIKTVLQKEKKENDYVPVVMVTHKSKEKNILTALADITELDIVNEKPAFIRIEE